jgi:hypothetical protein
MQREPESDRNEPREQTDYAPKRSGGAKPGLALSAWSLAIGGLFLVLVLGSLLLI